MLSRMYKPFETIRINVLIDNHLEIIQLTALKYISEPLPYTVINYIYVYKCPTVTLHKTQQHMLPLILSLFLVACLYK